PGTPFAGTQTPPAATGSAPGPPSAQDGEHRPAQDREIEPDAPVVNVPDVERKAVVPRQRVAAAHLHETGDAGTNSVPARLLRRVTRQILRQQRPGTDQRHVAAKHVQKLRQLVDAGFAEPAANRS